MSPQVSPQVKRLVFTLIAVQAHSLFLFAIGYVIRHFDILCLHGGR